jgi:hypothetical protein
MRSIAKTISLAIVLATLALLAPGRAEAIIVNWTFGLVAVVFDAGQAVQVNVANIGNPNEGACDALVEFLDVSGGLLKSARLIVPAVRSKAADLGVSKLIPLKGKVPVYARVTISDPSERP